jgi:hypothetical protein
MLKPDKSGRVAKDHAAKVEFKAFPDNACSILAQIII